MGTLRNVELSQASVPETASVVEAARTLVDADVSAIAVLGEGEEVVGLVTVDGLLGALFPRYLRELHHTAFIDDALEALAARADEAQGERVSEHMVKPELVDLDSSTLHAAERFLHTECGALAVVEEGRFAGVLDQVAFVRALLAQAQPGQ